MSEQELELAGSFRLLRDHWTTWVMLVVVGLAASIGYLFIRPPLYTASSLVLLPGSSGSVTATGVPANDMTTAAEVATSAGILTPAGSRVDPVLSFPSLRARVTAVGVATNVLKITAAGMNGPEAEALANAVASRLVEFETATGSATDQSELAGLNANAAQITQQIDDLNREITATTNRLTTESGSSPAGFSDAALVATLTNQENQATLQLDSVKSQIEGAKLGALAANVGTEVIQRATTSTPPSLLHDAYIAIVGVLSGLLLGIAAVLVRHRRDRRLHRRNEMADALGVPVLLSISAPRQRRSVNDWIELLKRDSPSAADRWNVQQALRELDLSGLPSHLTLLCLAGDTPGMAAAPKIAIVLSTLEVRTAFVLSPGNQFARHLRSACDRLSRLENRPRPNLQIWDGAPPEGSDTPELVITCVVVDPIQPALPLIRGATTLLAVSAGFGTAEQLAAVAIAATDAEAPVTGVILANPDVDDHTTGRFPQIIPRPLLAPSVRALAVRGRTR